MIYSKNAASGRACIETLESRRLLSASPMTHALPALVETHAVKVKPTIPAIAGTTYTGTFKAQGHTFSITVVFGAESSKGVLTSSTVSSDVSVGLSFPCKGTVKSTRAVALAGRFGKLTLAVRAKLSATLGTLSGKAVVHGKQSLGVPFTATLVTAM